MPIPLPMPTLALPRTLPHPYSATPAGNIGDLNYYGRQIEGYAAIRDGEDNTTHDMVVVHAEPESSVLVNTRTGNFARTVSGRHAKQKAMIMGHRWCQRAPSNYRSYIMWKCTYAAPPAKPLTRKDQTWHAELFDREYEEDAFPWQQGYGYRRLPSRHEWAYARLLGFIPNSPTSYVLLPCHYQFTLHANGLYMTLTHQEVSRHAEPSAYAQGAFGHPNQFNGPSHYAAWGILNDAALKPRKNVFPLPA